MGEEQRAEAAGGPLTHPESGRLLNPSLLSPPRVGTAVALACCWAPGIKGKSKDALKSQVALILGRSYVSIILLQPSSSCQSYAVPGAGMIR